MQRDEAGAAPTSDDAMAPLLREVIDALTALGVWLELANRHAGGQSESEGAEADRAILRETLAKSVGQHRRVTVAVRQLRDALFPEQTSRDDSGGLQS